MFVTIWSFRIGKESKQRFEQAYGPGGAWTEFFRKGKGYLGTELLGDVTEQERYVTIDRWASREHYEHFLNENRSEYEILDRRFEALTLEELHLGSFTVKRTLL